MDNFGQFIEEWVGVNLRQLLGSAKRLRTIYIVRQFPGSFFNEIENSKYTSGEEVKKLLMKLNIDYGKLQSQNDHVKRIKHYAEKYYGYARDGIPDIKFDTVKELCAKLEQLLETDLFTYRCYESSDGSVEPPKISLKSIEVEDVVIENVIINCYCLSIGMLYLKSMNQNDNKIYEFAMRLYARYTDLIFRCGVLFSFHIDKINEKRRNSLNVTQRSKAKVKNMSVIKRLLNENDDRITRNLILTAMKETNRSERTVRNIIKELQIEAAEVAKASSQLDNLLPTLLNIFRLSREGE